MKKNEWVAVVAVIVVVGLIAGVLGAGITGNAIFSNNLKANSCNADAICEANNIRLYNSVNTNGFGLRFLTDGKFVITDNQKTQDRLYIDSNGMVSVVSSSSAVLSLINKNYNPLNGWGIRILNDGTFTITDNQRFTDRLTINPSGSLSVNALAGSGNAYACADSTGKLYRSLTACK